VYSNLKCTGKRHQISSSIKFWHQINNNIDQLFDDKETRDGCLCRCLKKISPILYQYYSTVDKLEIRAGCLFVFKEKKHQVNNNIDQRSDKKETRSGCL
jgi:hypothetical protein